MKEKNAFVSLSGFLPENCWSELVGLGTVFALVSIMFTPSLHSLILSGFQETLMWKSS